MNGSVYNYYATQVFNEKLEKLNGQRRRNFAVSNLSEKNVSAENLQSKTDVLYDEIVKKCKLGRKEAGDLNNIIYKLGNEKDRYKVLAAIVSEIKDGSLKKNSDDILKRVAVLVKDEQTATKIAKNISKKPAKLESTNITADVSKSLISAFSDIMSHNLKSGANASIGEFLTDKTGQKTFEKLCKGNTAAFFKSSGNPSDKMPSDYKNGLSNLVAALKTGRDSKADMSKYNKAFRILMIQAYWIAFYTNRDKADDDVRQEKYITNRDKTIRTWVNNTESFKKAVEEGKQPRLAKTGESKTSSKQVDNNKDKLSNLSSTGKKLNPEVNKNGTV